MSELTPVENKFAKNLNERGFTVVRGFDEQVAEALHDGLHDPLIRYYTHDESRFKTMSDVYTWHEDSVKSPIIYSLVDTAIAGVVWFSNDTTEFSDATSTFAIRLYSGNRGAGLGGDFLEATHADLANTVDISKTWLSVRRDNTSAVRLYERHRYQRSSQTAARFIMTRSTK